MIALALSLGATAHAAPPQAGERCTLKRPVKASPRAKGPKRLRLKKGETLLVGEAKAGWTMITAGKRKGYLKTGELGRWCVVAPGEPAAPETAPEPPAPEPEEEPGAATLSAASVSPIAASPEAAAVDSAWRAGEKTKVAVMELSATATLPADLVASLSGVIAETLDRLGAFAAISSQDIVRLLNFEAQKQQLGCSDMACIAEIGGALGADYLVTGSLTQTGEVVLVQLQLANISAARIEHRVSREYRGAPGGLIEELRSAVRQLVGGLLAGKAGTLALRVNEEGATVRLDDVIVGVSPLAPLTVAGGPHALVVEKDGFVRHRQDIAIEAERTVEVSVALLPSREFARAHAERAGLMRALAWTGVGVGVAGLAGGGVLWFLGAEAAEDLNARVDAYNAQASRSTARYNRLDRREREIALFDLGAVTAAGVGVAGVVAAITLFAVGDDPDRYEATTRVEAAPALPFGLQLELAPGGAALRGRF